jgi:hypothetical protein
MPTPENASEYKVTFLPTPGSDYQMKPGDSVFGNDSVLNAYSIVKHWAGASIKTKGSTREGGYYFEVTGTAARQHLQSLIDQGAKNMTISETTLG